MVRRYSSSTTVRRTWWRSRWRWPMWAGAGAGLLRGRGAARPAGPRLRADPPRREDARPERVRDRAADPRAQALPAHAHHLHHRLLPRRSGRAGGLQGGRSRRLLREQWTTRWLSPGQSRPSCCRACSTRTPRSDPATAVWAWAWRWPGGWSSCTAARSRSAATDPVGAASSSCACSAPRRRRSPPPMRGAPPERWRAARPWSWPSWTTTRTSAKGWLSCSPSSATPSTRRTTARAG